MSAAADLPEDLQRRVDALSLRAEEAEAALRAIRAGEVDALVVGTGAAARVFTLEGADYAHRLILEAMSEGALTLTEDGTILYANLRFARMVGVPHERVVGASFVGFVSEPDRRNFVELLAQPRDAPCRASLALRGPAGALVTCVVSMSPVVREAAPRTQAVVITDVTPEFTRASEASGLREEWFRGALSSIGDAVITTDASGVVTFMNQAAAAITGEPAGSGSALGEVLRILDDRGAPLAEVAATVAAGGLTSLGDHTVLNPRDGTRRTIDGSAAPIRDSRGNVLGVVLVIRDISERKQAEEALRVSEERYRLAVAATSDALWDADLTANKVQWNHAYERAFGRPTVTTRPWQWKLGALHTEDREHVARSLAAAMDGGAERWDCEYRCQRVDGTWAYVHDRALIARDAAGRAVRAVGAMLDITERKRGEEAFQSRSSAEIEYLLEKTEKILDNIPTGVLALSDAEVTVAANRVLRERMPPGALGAPLPQAFPEAPSATILRLRGLIEQTRRSSQVESLFGEFLALFGEEERYNVHVVPLEPRFPDTRFLLVIEDLSEVRALEGQLLRAEKLATVGVLAAGIAHEVGTPLGVVRGRAEYVLGKLGPDHPQARGVNVIIEQIDHVTGTMRQLLDFARIRPATVRSVSAAAVVSTVLELLRLETERRRIVAASEVAEALPDLAADPDQLQQVLVNLIMNACDACSPGGRVTVRGQLEVGSGAADPPRVRLEVIDDGCGIPEEDRNQVFDPFFTTKKRGAGSGLGLAVVAQIVRNHRGEIELESSPGHGTRVTLLWPVSSRGLEVRDAVA